MPDSAPRLTIVLPNYNHAPFLAKALHSIVEQDFSDFELIIIDNASTDHSLAVIDHFRARDSRISFIEHPKNLGIYYSLNEGLSIARGEYIQYLNADDYFMPGFLSTCLGLLAEHPEVGISACDIYSFEDNLPELNPLHYVPGTDQPLILTPDSLASLFQTTALRVGGRNAIVKTEYLRKLHGFNEKFSVACDWYLFTKIALMHGLIYIPKPLICWRKTPDSLTERTVQSRSVRKELYANLLEDLAHGDPFLFHQFKRSGELGCVVKYAPLELLKRPKYWSFLPNIFKRAFHRRLKT